MINPYAISDLSELTDSEKESMENAMSEISALLKEAGGGPLTKNVLKSSMSGDTKPVFDVALKMMALNKMIYFTTKGYVNVQYEISIEERIAHIKWCLKLFDYSSNQYLMDKTVLLQVPETLKKLKDKYGSNFPKWRDEVLDVQKQSQMMGATLNELSEAYEQIAEAAKELLPPEKPNKFIGKSFEDLKEWSDELKKVPHCKHCGSDNGKLIGKNKDTFDCNECGRKS